MRPQDAAAIEQALPPGFRGRSGYKHLLDGLTLRVAVTGIRGKTALTRLAADVLQERGLSVYAKQTGTTPKSIKDGEVHPIQRDPRDRAVLDETYWEVKRHHPFDAMVLENQAITSYTMRTFNHLYCRPHYVLLTNIRRDHQGDLARRTDQMARHFIRSIPTGCKVVSGERDAALKAVMAREARGRNIDFIDAAPGRLVVPGYEALTILDAFLKDWMGEGLTRHEMATAFGAMDRSFRWQPTALRDVVWFRGAEINDVDSTQVVLDHLLHRDRRPVHFVAYMRKDRPDRTASFVHFLRNQFRNGTAASVTLVGHRVPKVAARLRPWRDAVHVVKDHPKTPARVLQRLTWDARGHAVMTIANAVPPWPRRFAELMEHGLPPPPDPRPYIDARLARALARTTPSH